MSRCLFAFGGTRDARDIVVYAMADDGTVLGSHFCSSVGFAYGDLDLAPISEKPLGGERDRRHGYIEHLGADYEVVNLLGATDAELDAHEGFRTAYALNQAKKPTPEAPNAAE